MHDEQGHGIADSTKDFDGWEIILIDRHKKGVCHVHMRRQDFSSNNWYFQLVFASDCHIPSKIKKLYPEVFNFREVDNASSRNHDLK